MNANKQIFAFQAVQSISPDEEQKSLCLADAWKLFWHPQARHKRQPEGQLQDGQLEGAGRDWKGLEGTGKGWQGHSSVPLPVCGLSLHCSHGMREAGRESFLL